MPHDPTDTTDPTTPTDPITDPGVTVAGGNPDKIDAVGGFHHAVAEKLEAHSALIRKTAGFLLNGWNGQASKQFHSLSADLSGHYEITGAEARAVGSALKKFAGELRGHQTEGKTALRNAIKYMNQVNHWQNKLSDLEPQVKSADNNVTTQLHNVAVARNALLAAPDPKDAQRLAIDYENAKSQLASARTTLNTLQNEQATASKKLFTASGYFTQWQKKGGQALQDAELSAGVAGYALGIVAINSPPVARVMNAALNTGPSGSKDVSWTAGLTGQKNYGNNVAGGGYNYTVGVHGDASATGSINGKGIQGELTANGLIGAQGSVQGHLGYTQFGVSGNAQGTAGVTGNADLKDGIGVNGVDLENNASVFAGAEITGSSTQNVGPFSFSENGQLSAGAGANANGTFVFSKNKIEIGWGVGATLGLGAGGGLSVAFDPEAALHDGERYGGDAIHGMAKAGKTALHYAEPWHW